MNTRYPLWQQDSLERGDPRQERVARGLAEYPTTWRAAVVTSVVDAEPQAITRMPGPSWWPVAFAASLLVVFAATLFDWYAVLGLGLLGCVVSVVGWFWPSKDERELAEVEEDGTVHGLPVYVNGSRALGWWGMLLTLLIFAVAIGSLVFSYYYLRVGVADWPPPGIPEPPLLLPAINLGVLIVSAGLMFWAVRGIRGGRQGQLRLGLAASFLLSAVFLGIQIYEWNQLGFRWQDHAYGSIFYTTAGTISLMVVSALVMTAVIEAQARLGYFNARRYLAIENVAMFTYFTAAAWVLVAAVLYLSPRLI